MMTPVVIVLLSLLVVLAAGQSTPNPPNPGDPIDWSVPFPDWFFDIKGQYEKREVRKCEFLEFVPATNDRCPGVSKKDHYYCIYGTPDKATYYCTCIEKDEYVFHCDSELRTVDYIRGIENGTISATDGTVVAPPPTPVPDVAPAPTDAPTPEPTVPLQTTAPGESPKPGDEIDWELPEPQWWHDIKDQYKDREVRKCEFLEFIPESTESCPGVSKFGHYYCVFGTPAEPTWFCTCLERNDFTFHCNPNGLQTPVQIHGTSADGGGIDTTDTTDTSGSGADTNSTTAGAQSTSSDNGSLDGSSFNGGFWTGFAVMGTLVLAYTNIKRWYDNRSARKNRHRQAPQFSQDDPDAGVTWMRRRDIA